jgi:RNA polymerase sigma-70 factor (ECF subfamily)
MAKPLTISSLDNVLLDELKKGDSKAFDLVFEKYYANLCRFAFSVIQDQDMSQSLVQNVFIKLWERRFVLGQIDNLAGYLVAMSKNQISDYRKEQRFLSPDPEGRKGTEMDNSTENEVLRRDFEERLLIALSKLPPRCRLAFEFSRFEDMSHKEIAREMNISVKGVEALIGRSLKTLRNELREFLPSFNMKNIDPILFFIRITKKIICSM